MSFTPEQLAAGTAQYNYRPLAMSMTELPGISVFANDPAGAIFHTYSTYARGLDMFNTAYHLLDIVPKGRDEAGLSYPQAWVNLRDLYDR